MSTALVKLASSSFKITVMQTFSSVQKSLESVAGDLGGGQPITANRSLRSRLLKAPHYEWSHAKRLMVNNSSTKSGCQTSDKVFTVLFQLSVLLCSAQTIFSARKWSR